MFVAGYIGGIVSMMLMRLSSMGPAVHELRGMIISFSAVFNDDVDEEIRKAVTFLSTAEEFIGFTVYGFRLTRSIYVVSWTLSCSTILINFLN